MAGFTCFIRREPIGVAGLIAPWNYPLMMAIWKIGPALAPGNTIVLKPSELTPLTALKLAEFAADIFPPGVFNVITGDGVPVGDTLVRHPDVGIVSLTGDVNTGKLIHANASDTLKRVHLELGGKAPVIVFDDADMATAVEWIKIAGYFNAGQDCTAATPGARRPEDLRQRCSPSSSRRWSRSPSATLRGGHRGRARSSPRSSSSASRASSSARRRPAPRCSPAASRWSDDGFFYKPTVVADPEQDAEIIQREVFGPVVTVQRFDDEEQALAWANGVDYGLASQRVDARRGPGDADGAQAAVRLRVGEHAHPAHAGDAARRVQAERARQGHVRLLPRGLHEHQARDGVARLSRPRH